MSDIFLGKRPVGRPRKEKDVEAFDLRVFEFSFYLRRKRYEIGLSQIKFAELLGLKQPIVSALESGMAEPTPQMVFRIEARLGCKPGELSRSLGYLPITESDGE